MRMRMRIEVDDEWREKSQFQRVPITWSFGDKRLVLQGYSPQRANDIVKKKGFVTSHPHVATWSEWHLILEGTRDNSQFKDMEEWKTYDTHAAYLILVKGS